MITPKYGDSERRVMNSESETSGGSASAKARPFSLMPCVPSASSEVKLMFGGVTALKVFRAPSQRRLKAKGSS